MESAEIILGTVNAQLVLDSFARGQLRPSLLCREWFARVAESSDGLIRSVLPQNLQAAAVELAPYLVDSIGNSTRIDYGTGHETTFCALLCCLAKLGVLTNTDLQVLLSLAHLFQWL